MTLQQLAEKEFPEQDYFDGEEYSVMKRERAAFIAGWEAEKWISVEDELPYKDGNSSIMCLVFGPYIDIVCRPYNEYHKVWDDEDYDDYFSDAVGSLITHWQPLPSPPKTK